MNLLLDALRPFGFNSRRIREPEILTFCEHERIDVVTDRIATSYYLSCNGRRRIVIPDHFQGLRREFALAHEFCHHLHPGNEPRTLYLGVIPSKEETEANEIATIALIPRSELHQPSILDEYPLGYAHSILEERYRLLREKEV